VSGNGRVRFALSRDGIARTDPFGTVDRFARVEAVPPTPRQLAALMGRHVSEEAEAVLDVAVVDGSLVVRRRPDTVNPLAPLYGDAFRGSLGVVRFYRDTSDQISELSVALDRAWDVRFKRQ
jgi:hypothetical protein